MKKSIISAITTGMILVGATATTFASANPFSDVPADHWAYDAVSQLAKDGVIEGYGDGTYKGDTEITRYEMAQMVARAMAKEDSMNATDKAMVQKLQAEFCDELSNLGVRVSSLEKKVDNVKWSGEVRYTYDSSRHDQLNGHEDVKNNENLLQFRLTPTATVNEHWQAKARFIADIDMNEDTEAKDTKLDKVYAEGQYGNTNIKLGKVPFEVDSNLIFNSDHQFSGGEVSFGSKVFKTTLGAGRFSGNDSIGNDATTKFNDTANYQFIGMQYTNSKFSGGLAYHHLNSKDFQSIERNDKSTTEDAQILGVNDKYQFDNNFGLDTAYAKNFKQDKQAKAVSVQLNYKGAKASQKGSWGSFLAYRYLGGNVAIDPSYDGAGFNQKGWELGVNYTLYPNTVLSAKYFSGSDLSIDNGDNSVKKLFGRVQFYF